MTEMGARYDRRARTYARCWAPVLAPAALRVLDLVAPDVAEHPRARVVDVGTGTGTLALAALRRWPRVRVIALDVSEGMLERTRASADATLSPGERARLELVAGAIADAVGPVVGASSADVAVSSFVLQLVPDRPAALRALRALLVPGGRLAFVTWAAERSPWAVEEAFDAALDDAGVVLPDLPGPARAGPFASPAAAATQLRRAGFRPASARTAKLDHPFTRASARDVVVEYDRAEEIGALGPDDRARLLAAFRRRVDALPVDALRWRAPLVEAVARRPG